MTPKVFASYSWTTTEHREWVRSLVDRLRGDGVDVVVDIYRLKEGHDKYAFMEQMVTDADISKVLVISDRQYAEKADARRGGVGTESIIISREVYEKVNQDKFIPVVRELSEKGKPYLPAFMQGRIYIDFSSEEKLHENYEQLLRAIFGKPQYIEPNVGRPPSFLMEEERVSTRTGFKLQMVKSAVLKSQPTAKGLIRDYLRNLAHAVQEDFTFKTEDYEGLFAEKVKANINRFLPYRDEFVEFIWFLTSYVDDQKTFQSVFEFFEDMLPYRHPPPSTQGFEDLADNFRFILYELFLYTIAAFIKNQRFETVDMFLCKEYFNSIQKRSDDDERYVRFSSFATDARSIEVGADIVNNQTAKLLRERAYKSELNYRDLMEADLVLFLRSILHREGQYEWFWLPKTLYGAPYNAYFPLFMRGESRDGFDNLKKVLDVGSLEDLDQKLKTAEVNDAFRLARLRVSSIKYLMNLDKLHTRS
jgi:hypothetical protein